MAKPVAQSEPNRLVEQFRLDQGSYTSVDLMASDEDVRIAQNSDSIIVRSDALKLLIEGLQRLDKALNG